MHEPLVSVVIPCFNAAEHIADSIRAALTQTWRNKEVIVVDDGSVDGSLDVIRSFGAEIRWESGKHRGGSAARNLGTRLARGDYIQYLDADDSMSPTKIEAQILALARCQDNAVASCPWNHFTAENGHLEAEVCEFWKCYEYGSDLLVDMWLAGGFFAPHCWLVPRGLIGVAGTWDESLACDQDGEFFGRVLVEAGRVEFVGGISAQYRKPEKHNVSASVDRGSVESRFRAWESVQKRLLARRHDQKALKAALRRLRTVTYSFARRHPDIIADAADYESQLGLWDFDPHLPPLSRVAIGMFGIKWGLILRSILRP